jgi:hypothetical protein
MAVVRQYKTLTGLGQAKLDIIESMLIKNTSAPKVVAKIQEEWKLLTDMKPGTLQKQLVRYKKDKITPHLHSKVLIPSDTKGTEDKVDTLTIFTPVDKRIDAHTALTELVEMQMMRMQKLYNKEHGAPLLFDAMRKEMGLMKDLLNQLSDLQFDLGLLKKVAPIQKHLIGSFSMTDTEVQQLHVESKEDNEQLAIATQKVIEIFKYGKLEEPIDVN